MAASPNAADFALQPRSSSGPFAKCGGWRCIAAVALCAAVAIAIGIGVGVGGKRATGALCRNAPTATADAWVSNTAMLCQGRVWTVSGSVRFVQNCDDRVDVAVDLVGLPPSSLHGFHVHANSSTADNCAAALGHFNPYSHAHGGEFNATRHVGDLGNLATDAAGRASVYFTDMPGPDGISLVNATRSIVNRTLVVHCSADDYGAGSSLPPFSSNLTGNAGNRTACALIAAAAPAC